MFLNFLAFFSLVFFNIKTVLIKISVFIKIIKTTSLRSTECELAEFRIYFARPILSYLAKHNKSVDYIIVSIHRRLNMA